LDKALALESAPVVQHLSVKINILRVYERRLLGAVVGQFVGFGRGGYPMILPI